MREYRSHFDPFLEALHILPCALVVPCSGTSTGLDAFMLLMPPAACSLIQLLRFRMTGPQVISRRVQWEAAFRLAIEQASPGVGVRASRHWGGLAASTGCNPEHPEFDEFSLRRCQYLRVHLSPTAAAPTDARRRWRPSAQAPSASTTTPRTPPQPQVPCVIFLPDQGSYAVRWHDP